MASNIEQPWMTTTTTSSSWYPTTDPAFARETESALTKALQQSLFNDHPPVMVVNDYYYNYYSNNNTASASTITVSGSGSETETPRTSSTPKGNNNLGVLNNGCKTTKRKSRASKRSMTTFIQADPANFRQMVQQVTGVKFQGNANGNGNGQFPSDIKSEAVRQPYINNKLQGLLPTLDTSAFLVDHHTSYRGSSALAQDGAAAVGNDFYAFSCFPTLESSI